MIGRSYRHARSFRCLARPALGGAVSKFPFIGTGLLFLPVRFVVIPVMGAAHLHAGITLALEFLEAIVTVGKRFWLRFDHVSSFEMRKNSFTKPL